MYFHYGETEIEYLKQKDPKMGEVIQQVGHIDREVDPDLFSAVVHHIVGQQISKMCIRDSICRSVSREGGFGKRRISFSIITVF